MSMIQVSLIPDMHLYLPEIFSPGPIYPVAGSRLSAGKAKNKFNQLVILVV